MNTIGGYRNHGDREPYAPEFKEVNLYHFHISWRIWLKQFRRIVRVQEVSLKSSRETYSQAQIAATTKEGT
jgi:hypothetical protein